MATLTSARPGGKGKGKGGAPRRPPQATGTPFPQSSRTEELCPDDWLNMKDDMDALDEIIRKMDEQEEIDS